MSVHNKVTFTAEYCKARHIPYSIKNAALSLNGSQVCLNLYALTYTDIIHIIDNEVEYDSITMNYIGMKPNAIYEIEDDK